MIDYHVKGKFGERIGVEGFEGYIRCLQQRQKRELSILSQLPINCLVLDNPQHDWNLAEDAIYGFLMQEE